MNASRSPAKSPKSLGSIALVLLLVASLVLGVLVYRARTPDLALEVTSFPRSFEDGAPAAIAFFVRFADDDAKVEIVGRNQVVVRTLAESVSLSKEERVRCLWDGLDDEGERAPPGRYRLRVTLPSEGRTMVFPRRLDLELGQAAGKPITRSQPCASPEGLG